MFYVNKFAQIAIYTTQSITSVGDGLRLLSTNC